MTRVREERKEKILLQANYCLALGFGNARTMGDQQSALY